MGEDDICVTETEGEGKVVNVLKVERDLKVCFSRLGMHAHNGPLLSYNWPVILQSASIAHLHCCLLSLSPMALSPPSPDLPSPLPLTAQCTFFLLIPGLSGLPVIFSCPSRSKLGLSPPTQVIYKLCVPLRGNPPSPSHAPSISCLFLLFALPCSTLTFSK